MPRKDRGDKKPSEKVLEEQPEVGNVKPSTPSDDVRPQTGIDRAKFTKKALALGKKYGVNVKPLIEPLLEPIFDWADGVERRFQIIVENMPTKDTVKAGINEALTDMAKRGAEQQKQAMHDAIDRGEMPRGGGQGGGGMGGIGQLLGLLGGGGEDDEMKQLQREMFKVNIEGMKAGIHMSNAITGAIVNKITGKAIGDVVEGIVK